MSIECCGEILEMAQNDGICETASFRKLMFQGETGILLATRVYVPTCGKGSAVAKIALLER